MLSSSTTYASTKPSNVLHTHDRLILTVSLVKSDAFGNTLLILNFFSTPFYSRFDQTSLLINVILEPLPKRVFLLIFFIPLLRITGMICNTVNLFPKALWLYMWEFWFLPLFSYSLTVTFLQSLFSFIYLGLCKGVWCRLLQLTIILHETFDNICLTYDH